MKPLKTSIIESYVKESKLDTSNTTTDFLSAAVDMQNGLTGVIVGGVFKYGSSTQKNAEKIIKNLGYSIVNNDLNTANANCAYMIYNGEKIANLIDMKNDDIYILNSI